MFEALLEIGANASSAQMRFDTGVAFPLQHGFQFIEAPTLTRKLIGSLNNAYSLHHLADYRSSRADPQWIWSAGNGNDCHGRLFDIKPRRFVRSRRGSSALLRISAGVHYLAPPEPALFASENAPRPCNALGPYGTPIRTRPAISNRRPRRRRLRLDMLSRRPGYLVSKPRPEGQGCQSPVAMAWCQSTTKRTQGAP